MVLEQTMQTVGNLFRGEPKQWGLRGDKYLWRELKEKFAGIELPKNQSALQRLLETAFWEATGQCLAFCDETYIERFAYGGMSSGGISGDFWRSRGFPIIFERFQNTSKRQ